MSRSGNSFYIDDRGFIFPIQGDCGKKFSVIRMPSALQCRTWAGALLEMLEWMKKNRWDSRFMEMEMEENVQNDKLLEYKEYLSKPVEIDTPYGKFVLDRSMSWFEGEIELNGLDFTAFLETDEDNGETAELALKVFLKTAENFEDFDRKNKEFAADNLLDLAHEWQESDEGENEPLTREQFIEAIGVSEWTVTPYGNMTLYYYDGDIFWGHAIEINIDEDGTIEDADIAG